MAENHEKENTMLRPRETTIAISLTGTNNGITHSKEQYYVWSTQNSFLQQSPYSKYVLSSGIIFPCYTF